MMIDILIVYSAFMYLFTGGLCAHSAMTRGCKDSEAIGMAMHFITAPISTPVLLGIIFSSKNY